MEILEQKEENQMHFFKAIFSVCNTESTMDLAKEIRSFFLFPFVVRSTIQTSGRGQHKRQWESSEGGLWLTFCFQVAQAAGLSTYFSIPVAKTISQIAPSCNIRVKWPNDVLLEGKKVAGILIELQNNMAFVGVGINVKNKLPPYLSDCAISLKDVTEAEIEKVFESLMQNIESTILTFLEKGFSPFMKEYWHNLIFARRQVEVSVEDAIIKGEVIGIGKRGELRISENGKVIAITNGSIVNFY